MPSCSRIAGRVVRVLLSSRRVRATGAVEPQQGDLDVFSRRIDI